MIASATGLVAGACEAEPSAVGGPDSGKYADLGMDVQLSAEAATYFPDSVCSAAAAPGALAVPGADRGYATIDAFCIVKGGTGVMVTSAAFDDGTTTAQWLALAEAVLAEL